MISLDSIKDGLQIILNNQLTKAHFDEQVGIINQRLDDQEDKIRKIQERVTETERKSKYSTANDFCQESHRQEQCKNNVILLGVKEEVHINQRKVFEAEQKKVNQLLSDLKVQHGELKLKLKRLGKKTVNQSDCKPRPLCVKLKNTTMRNMVFANANKLNGNEKWKGISIVPDLTKLQHKIARARRIELLEEASKRNRDLKIYKRDDNIEWQVKGHYGLGNLRLHKSKPNSNKLLHLDGG